MPDPPPAGLRECLRTKSNGLAAAADNLWRISQEIHDRQNRPDSNENGRRHVEQVESNIWRLLTETHDEAGALKIEGLKPREIFLLSCVACCHDFDKALKSAQLLPKGFQHGEGSGAFVVKNAATFGLDEHQARETADAISIHDLKAGEFQEELRNLNKDELTPDGPINLQRVAVLLKAADILHCDYSRIPRLAINPTALEGLDRKKYLARKCTQGWMPDGRRILVQASPNDEQKPAFSACFQYMKTHEWEAVRDGLDRWGFPHQLALHNSTAHTMGAAEPAPEHEDSPPDKGTPNRDLLKGYPEPQPKWVGRVAELAELHTAWLAEGTRVYSIIGFGGEGKTALARRFHETLRRAGDVSRRPVVVWWSFYFNRAADEFFAAVLTHFNIPLKEDDHPLSAEQRAAKLTDLLRTGIDGRPLLLVLDGFETMQDHTAGREGQVTDTGLRELLRATLDDERPDTPESGTILITTREPLRSLRREADPRYGELTLNELTVPDGAALLTQQYGLKIDPEDAEAFVKEVGGHALTLTLTGGFLRDSGAAAPDLAELRKFIAGEEAKVTDRDLTSRGESGKRAHRLPGYVLRHCRDKLKPAERQFMRLLSCCVRPAEKQDIEEVFLQQFPAEQGSKPINDKLAGGDYTTIRNGVIHRLLQLPIIDGNEDSGFDVHPLIRRHYYEEEGGPAALTDDQRKAVHSRFFDVLTKRSDKHHPDTMEEMQPLIDAVLHGCRADRADEALGDVFYTRIGRKDAPDRTTFYMTSDLGAVETELELLRSFFPGGDFSNEADVSDRGGKGFLINSAALALLNSGRPATAVPLHARSLGAADDRSNWANANAVCQNLCDSYLRLGRLSEAAKAAADALDYIGRVPADHQDKRGFTQFSHGYAATVAAFRGDDEAASTQFTAALELDPGDWLASLDGGWHCTWLARRGVFERARSGAEQNAAFCAERGDLPNQAFTLATQALVERLAWAAGDAGRTSLVEMSAYAARAVEVGRRSGHHFYLTYALLEAGRCTVTRAEHETQNRKDSVRKAEKYLAEAEQRAEYADYRLILADAHVARAGLALLAGDEDEMRRQCQAALDICNDRTCDYAWAREDAEALLARGLQ
ncbi:MAG: ATP-binding protein [bacterium]|nr:ATP-binding protein [bacterium]